MACITPCTVGGRIKVMSVEIIDNALPVDLITDVVNYAKTQLMVRTNHTSWGAEVVGVSGPIYIVDLKDDLRQRIKDHLLLMLPNQKLADKDMIATYNMAGRYSFIPWHDDAHHVFSVTVYLNLKWDDNWAGHFIYERKNSDELVALLPKFNRAVCFEPPVQHYVAMPNVNAPLRCTLQVFFNSKESSGE